MTTLRAHFDGKVLVPDEPVDLPMGRSLKLGVLDEEPELVSGSPSAIRAAMKEPPHFTAAEIAAFNEAIEGEKRPARSEGILRRVMRRDGLPARHERRQRSHASGRGTSDRGLEHASPVAAFTAS